MNFWKIFEEERSEKEPLVKRYFHEVQYDAVRAMI
jgi:hypothetical protein